MHVDHNDTAETRVQGVVHELPSVLQAVVSAPGNPARLAELARFVDIRAKMVFTLFFAFTWIVAENCRMDEMSEMIGVVDALAGGAM